MSKSRIDSTLSYKSEHKFVINRYTFKMNIMPGSDHNASLNDFYSLAMLCISLKQSSSLQNVAVLI